MTTYSLAADAAEFYDSTFVPGLFAAWAERLAALVSPGQRVLDVACGTGAVARAAAAAAGPDGTVAGLDAGAAMLAVARRRRPDLAWHLGNAERLPFPDGAFDWALCQAALMFFGDRVAALREMGRVAGRVAVQVPGRLSHSAGYRILADVVARHAGGAARDLLGAYFAVGDPDELRALFAGAGLAVDEFRTWTGATRLASVDTFLDAELLPLAGEPARNRIAAEARSALAPFLGPDGAIAAPIEVHLVVARGNLHAAA